MKSNFIKSTIILLIGGFISKLLGMITKIALTRSITTTGIGIYMLILPTFNLLITLCTLGLPTAISKLVSEKRKNNQKLVLSIIPIIIIFNGLLMLILFLIAPFISNYLLKNSITYYPVMAIGLTLPFICISSIIRGYFFGKEKMIPHCVSIIIEQLVRLILTIYFIPNLLKISIEIAITGVVLINIISEFTSIIILLLFLPKNIKVSKKDFKYDKCIMKDMLNISIPTTGSRLIGSISYFLEPVILTFCLLKIGYNNDFITTNYGIINGYVFSLLLLPSFFTLAISNALLPIISNSYVNKKFKYAYKKIKQAIYYSLIIGIPITIIFMIIPEFFLKLIYNTNEGVNYIKVVAPFFLLFYIQSPLTSSLQAIGKADIAMKGTFYGAIIRTILLFILCFSKIGIWGLIIATCSNILFVTIHHLYWVNRLLKKETKSFF